MKNQERKKNFRKTPISFGVMIILKNAIFARSASLHMLETFLNLEFLYLLS